MIDVSPDTSDFYLDPSHWLLSRLAEEGISDEELSRAQEEFENLINSFLTTMKNAGYSHYTDCGQIYFEKGNFHFMLTNYI